MSRYQMDKFLRDVNRDQTLARRWREGAAEVFDGYALSAEERAALARWEVRRLYEMGANPLLLLLSSMAAGKSMRGYIAALRGEAQSRA
ncbi:MAG TPA: hypothetical protein VFB33_03295 [Candidatus Binataceae bacterium]|jgi:hypothetical protein|nr:hypothetical protein [Candidatus Binataceae bacterium]